MRRIVPVFKFCSERSQKPYCLVGLPSHFVSFLLSLSLAVCRPYSYLKNCIDSYGLFYDLHMLTKRGP